MPWFIDDMPMDGSPQYETQGDSQVSGGDAVDAFLFGDEPCDNPYSVVEIYLMLD